jgi:hypothetical protein
LSSCCRLDIHNHEFSHLKDQQEAPVLRILGL